jgi:hypothetical protein
MFSNIKKIIAASGLMAVCVAFGIAGTFHIDTTSGPWTATAVVPSAGNCEEVCMQGPYANANAYVNGPLGYYSVTGTPNQVIDVKGPVAAGTYSCAVYRSYAGAYAMVDISW